MSTTRCPSTALVPDDFRPHIIIIICAFASRGGSLFSPAPAAGWGVFGSPPGGGVIILSRASGGVGGVWHAGLKLPTTTHAGDAAGDAWVAERAWVSDCRGRDAG